MSLLLYLCMIWASCAVEKSEPVRIACIGDSITYGAFIENREVNSYSAKLQAKLGEGYLVKNFGVKGACILEAGKKSIFNEKSFQDALAFEPHVVIIALGTNDANIDNWKGKEQFQKDYEKLLQVITSSGLASEIIIVVPPGATANEWGINPQILKDEINPQLEIVASELGVKAVNLSKILYRNEFLKDGIHPNQKGASKIAEAIYQAINQK